MYYEAVVNNVGKFALPCATLCGTVQVKVKSKAKGKVHPGTGHEGPEGE
jgi:hypothetical protein